MSWDPKGTWQEEGRCPDAGWRTAKVFNFVALPDYNFLTAGDGTHDVAGVDVVVDGSSAASTFAVDQGTGLVWTRTGAGTTRLSIPVHALWTMSSDDRWRATIYMAENQAMAAGDVILAVVSTGTVAPAGTDLALLAQWISSSGHKVRTNHYSSTWNTNVDTAWTPSTNPMLELDVWRTHMVVRGASRAPSAALPAAGSTSRIVEVGHRLASGNTASEWGSSNRYLQLGFTASAGSTLAIRRVVIQRLLTGG